MARRTMAIHRFMAIFDQIFFMRLGRRKPINKTALNVIYELKYTRL
jgi:hypothetical protein